MLGLVAVPMVFLLIGSIKKQGKVVRAAALVELINNRFDEAE